MKTTFNPTIKNNLLNQIKSKKPMLLENAMIYQDGMFKKMNLFLKDGKIVDLTKFNPDNTTQFDIVDLQGNYLTPSLVDQHVHGGLGYDFNTANESQMRAMLRKMKEFGCGAILATFIPGRADVLNRQIDIIKNIMDDPKDDETKIAGIHLEGPFINPLKSGIHPLRTMMPLTLENAKKINLNDVKIVTVAPELDKGFKTIKYFLSKGIIPSAGHSVASADLIKESRVPLITHLFNAMSGYHHRLPTIANEGLENNDISVELNTDNKLIHYGTMDLVAKTKPEDKFIMISDALAGASCNEKSFDMNGKTIYIDKDGTLRDENNVLAGSNKYLGQVAKDIVENTKIKFADFIRYASENPAKNIGIIDKHRIAKGTSPSLTLWDKETLEPVITFEV